MTIKSKMLLIILLGIGGLFVANFYSSAQLNTAHKNYSSEESPKWRTPLRGSATWTRSL